MSAYDDLEAMAAQELRELRELNAKMVSPEVKNGLLSHIEELRELNAELSLLLKRAALVIERNLERRLGLIDEIETALIKAEAMK